MKKFTLALCTILGLSANSAALKHDDLEMKLLWEAWKDTHGKEYSGSDEAHRAYVFADNYNKIMAHNAQDSTVTLGLNKFADLTEHEWKAQYAGGHHPHNDEEEEDSQSLSQEEEERLLSSLPSSFDWRSKGAVGPVKNQKSCSGCWSFAASGALEALHHIKTGSLLSFSEQQLLDCDSTNNGCKSGNILRALKYTGQKGIELESAYPFADKVTSCKYSSGKTYKVNSGYKSVAAKNVNALMSAIVNQPVLVAIEANQHVFQFYKSGVISSGCGTSTDHAVLAIGYTTVNGQKAFIVKNSYGAGWGMNGYAYISASSTANSGKGVCGILTYAGYPTA